MKQAIINEFGDVVCPECFINLITPEQCYLKYGENKCIYCGKFFNLTISTISDSLKPK